jgi:orotidine-5'-phosphate decarboxylase
MDRSMAETPVENRIFCALDTVDLDGAEKLAQALVGTVGGIKLGKEFFTAHGPAGAARVCGSGLPLFLDLKFHDIPNTVAGAVCAALALKPAILTVHAAGGAAMLRAAVGAAAAAGAARPLIVAVTVLTSLDDDDLAAIGVPAGAAAQVARLARLAQDCGLDGVVCSPVEITEVRARCGSDFKLVVPGIRPAGAASGDQKRVMTPEEAVGLGADYLVIGRPITGADDPAAAARTIAAALAAAV